MASKKKAHVQSNHQENTAVLERKLRPIYDCLDFGNYKKALQESEKVLKKHPTSACAQALKAISLIRLGKTKDGISLADQVKALKPADESTLQVLTISYKEVNQHEPIVELYEHAVEQDKDNEDFLSQLFVAYVRLNNYAKQVEVAVKLHKLKPDNNPYYYWWIMSLVLQALAGDPVKSSMWLTLAEKLVRKGRPNVAPIEKNAEATLLLIIMEKQGRLQECLDLIQGKQGDDLAIDVMYKETRVAELLYQTGRVDSANAIYRKLVSNYQDNWAFYPQLINTTLQLVDQSYQTTDSSPSDCISTINGLKEFLLENRSANESRCKKPERGPVLSLLQFYYCLSERREKPDQLSDEMQQVLLEYFKMFSGHPCCFVDTSKYVAKLLELVTDRDAFLGQVWSVLELAEEVDSEGALHHYAETKQIQKHVLYLQLQRFSGALTELSDEDKVSRAEKLRTRFVRAANTVEKDTLSTDIKACDSYILLSAHLLMDVYTQTGDKQYCIRALSCLEQGLKASPSSHQLSVLMVYLYTMLGAYGPIQLLVGQMDVKQILFDSMAYIYSGQALTCGYFSAAHTLYTQMLKFYTCADREIAEGLIQCYRYGTFSKVQEFDDYQSTTAHSSQYAMARTERNLIDVLSNKTFTFLMQTVDELRSLPLTDPVRWDKLSDKRDIPIAHCWDHVSFTSDMRSATFDEQKHWLRQRSLSLRLLVTCTLVTQSSNVSQSSELSSALNNLLTEYRHHLTNHWSSFRTPEVPRFTVIATRLEQEVQSGRCHLVIDMSQIVLAIAHASNNEVNGDAAQLDLAVMFKSLIEKLEDSVKSTEKTNISTNTMSMYIAELSSCYELLAMATMFAGIYWVLYAPLRQQASHTRKKKGGASAAPPSKPPQALSSSNAAMKQLISKLKALLNDLQSRVSVLSMSSLTAQVEELAVTQESSEQCEVDEFTNLVKKNLQLSYDMVSRDISEQIANKKHFLEDLTSQ